jgi:hypothetical protein
MSRERVLSSLGLPNRYAARVIAVPVELLSQEAGIRLASEAAKPLPVHSPRGPR